MNDLFQLQAQADALFSPALAQEVSTAIQTEADSVVSSGAEALSAWTLGLADRFYKKLTVGKLEGRANLTWNGMDSFVYEPDPELPLRYTASSGRVVEPRRMNTDGGSIPRLLWASKKFSPWGYAPAFLVHDWLFIAHKCGHAPDTDWEFDQTATVMAEIMKTLMEVGFTDYSGQVRKLPKKEDTLYLMYQAVSSGIAKSLWDDPTTVECMG